MKYKHPCATPLDRSVYELLATKGPLTSNIWGGTRHLLTTPAMYQHHHTVKPELQAMGKMRQRGIGWNVNATRKLQVRIPGQMFDSHTAVVPLSGVLNLNCSGKTCSCINGLHVKCVLRRSPRTGASARHINNVAQCNSHGRAERGSNERSLLPG